MPVIRRGDHRDILALSVVIPESFYLILWKLQSASHKPLNGALISCGSPISWVSCVTSGMSNTCLPGALGLEPSTLARMAPHEGVTPHFCRQFHKPASVHGAQIRTAGALEAGRYNSLKNAGKVEDTNQEQRFRRYP